MIHFCGPWLEHLHSTAIELKDNSHADITKLAAQKLSRLEFNLHTALFCVRKLEESVGIPLDLKVRTIILLSWAITLEKKKEIIRTPDPQLEEWYDLKHSTREPLSYLRIIDIFIHARLCNYTQMLDDNVIGVFVSSDHTMKERIYYVTFADLSKILNSAIEVLAPIVEKRKRKAQQVSSIR